MVTRRLTEVVCPNLRRTCMRIFLNVGGNETSTALENSSLEFLTDLSETPVINLPIYRRINHWLPHYAKSPMVKQPTNPISHHLHDLDDDNNEYDRADHGVVLEPVVAVVDGHLPEASSAHGACHRRITHQSDY